MKKKLSLPAGGCRFLLKRIAVMAVCILLGTLLILAAYRIPTGLMWNNVRKSVPTLEREGIYYQILDTQSSRLDNFTDAFMIGNVISSRGNGLIDDAMSNYRTSGSGLNNIESLKAFVNDEDIGFWSYGRYWHGYLVFLKPLFVFFSYSQIRWINVFLQVALISSVCILLVRKGKAWFCLPVLVTWCLLCPPALMLSLQFSSVFYITFLACLLILLFHQYLDQKRYSCFFMIVGAVTSYLDLLTYPIVTAVIPLTAVFVMRGGESLKKRQPLPDLIGYGASWGIGFGLMWASKWCIATLLTGKDYITESFNQILMRTSNVSTTGETLPVTSGLRRSAEALLAGPVPVLLVGVLMLLAVYLIRNRKCLHISFTAVYPMLLLACVPVVWLLLTCNHSTVHFWFTFRSLTASVFALLSGILMTVVKPEQASDRGGIRA